MKKIFIILVVFLATMSTVAISAEIDGVPVIDQDIFEVTLNTDDICGPTAASEVLGFWGLSDEPLSGAIPDDGRAMENMLSEMMLRTGHVVNVGVYPDDLIEGMHSFAHNRDYELDITHHRKYQARWSHITSEIDAGRPVILLSWRLYHYVVVIGYNESGPVNTLKILYGHIPYERDYTVAQLGYDAELILVRVVRDPDPDPDPDPSGEYWYQDVMNWCEQNGYELEPID